MNPPTVPGIFADACRWKGDEPFLLDDAVRLSGHEAGRAAERAAAALRGRGIGKGSTVAFLCGPSVAHAVAFFAGQTLGAVCCALHVRDTDRRVAATLARIEARAVVADPDQMERAAALARGCPGAVAIPLEPAATGTGPARQGPLPRPPVAPDDPAVLLLSSGTTGDPKCVLHTHRTVAATAFAGPFVYGVDSPADGVAIPMAPSFAAWIHTVMPFVAMRGRLRFVDRFDPEGYFDLVAGEGLTVAALVPTAWRMALAGTGERDLSRLRVAFFSGERGSTSLVEDLSRLAPSVRSVYLASEGGCAAAVAANERVLVAAGKATAAGQPIPGADLRVVDPDGGLGDVLPPGETGEVAVSGPSVAAGYLGDPELTRSRFAGGWWRTGDLGYVDDGGQLHVRGRTDNRINSGGIKVHAEEVENALLRHPAVREAAVVGVDDAILGERIEAHLVLGDEAVAPSEILSFCEAAGALPRALLPKVVHLHRSLPTSPTGKLYRRGLRPPGAADS